MDENITFQRKLEIPVETTPDLQASGKKKLQTTKKKTLNRQV